MNVNYSNHKDAAINDYYLDFEKIWARDVDERSIFDLWLHVIEHASKVANGIKLQVPSLIIDDLADTAVWLMSFMAFCRDEKSGLFSLELPDVVIWNKYPGICPSCFDNAIIDSLELTSNERESLLSSFDEERINDVFRDDDELLSCDCVTRVANNANRNQVIISSHRSELNDIRIRYAKMHEARRPRKLRDIELMFAQIYENYYHIETLDSLVIHMLRALGEASQALVNLYTFDDSREPFTEKLLIRRKQRFSDQLADIWGWLFGICIKMRFSYSNIAKEFYKSIKKDETSIDGFDHIDLTDIIWAKYGMTSDGANWDNLRCSGCQSTPCICKRDIKIAWNETECARKARNKNYEDRDLLFISYSHKNQNYLPEIKNFLTLLERNGTLSYWDDTRIKPGSLWKEELESALSRAKVALLLVSPDYLASDYIYRNELPPLLEAAKKGGARIAWIPLIASSYSETEIEKYQALWDPDKPLVNMKKGKRNEAYVQIFETIKGFFV